jgi:DTW domain-containing protein YfiP
MKPQIKKIDKKDACPECYRPKDHCFCHTHSSVHNEMRVLILQHPQEQYKLLNSARLAHAVLQNSTLKVGLSWRNFSHALGEDANSREWGVLYLKAGGEALGKPVEMFDSKKRLVGILPKLKGLVVIDGSWKQAKALWWRNPWLLRLNRISLNMQQQSLRSQIKSEGLSTIEAIACGLGILGEKQHINDTLIQQYEALIIKPAMSYHPIAITPARNPPQVIHNC